MIGWLHLLKDSLYFPGRADEVCGSIGIHISFPGRAFLSPYIIGFHNLQIRFAQQRKGRTMFSTNFWWLLTLSMLTPKSSTLDCSSRQESRKSQA